MSAGIVLTHVVQVVGRDQRQVQILSDPQQVGAVAGFYVEVVVHEFDIEVVLAQDVAEVSGGGYRAVVLPGPQPHVDLTAGAPGGGDEAFAVPVQQFPVESRLAVVPLDAGHARQPEQVVHTFGGLGQHRHVGIGLFTLHGGRAILAHLVAGHVAEVVRCAGVATLRGVVPLDADDRLDTVLLPLLVEVVGPEHVAVIGHGDRGHFQPSRFGEQIVEPGSAVQHRVLGVHVQVHERVRHGAPLTSSREWDSRVSRSPDGHGSDAPTRR